MEGKVVDVVRALAGVGGDGGFSACRVGVLSKRDNVGEVFGVMPKSDENIELECEVDEDVERHKFGQSGDCGCVRGSGCKEWSDARDSGTV